jgi:non-canonical (house-cleaning) NTP pyrophosphatase
MFQQGVTTMSTLTAARRSTSTRHDELMGRNVLVQRLGRIVAGRIVDTVDGTLPNGETGATFVTISPRAAQDIAISGEWINLNEIAFEDAPIATPAPAPVKTITYDRLTGDYKMELDGEFVGYEATYHLAEIELDRLAYEQLDRAGGEPELALSATALDGVCACGATFNEYGQCEACLALRKRLLAIITTDEPVLAQLLTTPDNDQPATDPGHNLVTPDPAECPSTTEPQPCEDCPNCGGSNIDQSYKPPRCRFCDPVFDIDELRQRIQHLYAPVPDPYFILPSGDTTQSIILCVGGVSRVVNAQGVAEALTIASTQPRPAITVVLTSQSAIKLRALQAALVDLNITANVVAVKVPSGVNEQPVGDETRHGALNRIAAAREQVVGDLYVSIENGLFHRNGIWTDRAVVVVEQPGNAHVPIIVSDGCAFPLSAVEEAKHVGFATTTVGQVLAEWGIVKDHADPHVDVCGTSRETFLRAAVRQALAAVLT